MKAQAKPWRFEIAWGSPYTEPPDGQPRVLMSVTRLQIGGHPVPDQVLKKSAEMGYGSGWALHVYVDLDWQNAQRRKLSPEAKGRIRRKRLEAAAAKQAPLFADQIVQDALREKPDYFEGV